MSEREETKVVENKLPVCYVCGQAFDVEKDAKERSLQDQDISVRLSRHLRAKIEWNRTKYSYSDCGGGEVIEVDICPMCFATKLVPWLESFGHRKVEPREWDY